MKTFRTVGSGSTQTIEPIENNKIPVYETKTAAENDLANLEVGQIIATRDEGNELPNPVDVVQDGNMHAVTSNAVYDSVSGLNPVDVVQDGNMKSVTSNAVADSISGLKPVDVVQDGNMKSVTSNAVADSISGLKPVDVIEVGNMSAVTSNAVYNYLNDVEVIEPIIISIQYVSNISIKITRYGHLVNINISFAVSDNYNTSHRVSGSIAKGIPAPKALVNSNDYFYLYNNRYKDSGNTIYISKNNEETFLSIDVLPGTTYSLSAFYII